MKLKIAIPTSGGLLCQHFGHAEAFTFVEVDAETKSVLSTRVEAAPVHEHGVLPRWLSEKGAQVVIAGGLGAGARTLLAAAGIELVAGAETQAPAEAVAAYLAGTLKTGPGSCSHGCDH
jgi:predicted Fe-Mo cluster-binding NifX family protein